MSADIPDALGWVACPLMRHFCVVPGTPVLTADLRWIPAGKIAAGDELVGVDEWPVRARATRAFRRAVVEELIWRTAECLIITVDDGREVTCSADHRWLAKRRWMGTGQKGRGSFEWRASDQLQPGDRIFSPLRVWDDETSFEAGWLSGMFDGEGCANRCLTGPGRKYFNTHLSVAQNPGPVLDRLEAVLASMGIGYRKEPRHAARDQCMRLTITPRSDAIELLGRLQPTRLRAEVLWEDASAQQRHARFAVVTEIRPAGQAEVVSMSTSTGTFLANGMVAHNCIDNAWKTLGQQAGCLRYLPDVVVEHRHWSSGAADFDETYQHAGVFTPEGEDSEAYAEWWNTRAAADIEAIRGLRSRMV